MPQMSPMWWEIMFMMFILLFMLTSMILYWMTETKIKKDLVNKTNYKELDWKL